MTTVQIPHSLQAEQAILGGLLLDNVTWSGISDHLVSKDFYQSGISRQRFKIVVECVSNFQQ